MPAGAEVEPEAPEDYREEKSKVIPVEQHLGLARKVAWKYRGAAEQEELLSVAYLGLTKAGVRYQPERGGTFSTFAYIVVESEILIFLRKEKRWKGLLSLDDPIPGTEGLTFQETIPDPADPFLALENRLLAEEILETGNLTPAERKTMKLYYQEGKTQTEVGRLLGVSQTVICRKLRTAVGKLQKGAADAATPTAPRKKT